MADESKPLDPGSGTSEFKAMLAGLLVTLMVALFGVPRDAAQSFADAVKGMIPAVTALVVTGGVVWQYVAGRLGLKTAAIQQASSFRAMAVNSFAPSEAMPAGPLRRVAAHLGGDADPNLPACTQEDVSRVLEFALKISRGREVTMQDLIEDARAAEKMRQLFTSYRAAESASGVEDILVPLIPVFLDLLQRFLKRRRG